MKRARKSILLTRKDRARNRTSLVPERKNSHQYHFSTLLHRINSFISHQAARRLKLKPLKAPLNAVTVANGDRLMSKDIVEGCVLDVQSNANSLSVSGNDVILGRLKQHNPIKIDFEYTRDAPKIHIYLSNEPGVPERKAITGVRFLNSKGDDHTFLPTLHGRRRKEETNDGTIHSTNSPLLEQYEHIFQDPIRFPFFRTLSPYPKKIQA